MKPLAFRALAPALAPALPVVPILVATALVYAILWPLLTSDLTMAYVPWMRHILAAGRIAAFAAPFSDYSPPYLYLLSVASLGDGLLPEPTLVKLVSVTGTVLLALAVRRLLRVLGVEGAGRLAAWTMLLPSVALNAAFMASGDALWAAPSVLAVACAIERRHAAMLIWCGVALAVKVQAIFAAPFFLGVLLAHRVPLRLWPLAPAATLAVYLPAWLVGWPAANLLTVYVRLSAFYDDLALNVPNVWEIAQRFPGVTPSPFTTVGNLATIAVGIGITTFIATRRLSARALLLAAALCPMLIVGTLPRMHERYFFLADVLAFAAACVFRDRHGALTAMLVVAGSTFGIFAYMTGASNWAVLGAVAMMIGTWRTGRHLLRAAPAPSPQTPANA